MTPEKLAKAVELILKSTKSKVAFNVPVTDSYSNVYQILIQECCPNLVNQLVAEGFSLGMNHKGLSVEHHG